MTTYDRRGTGKSTLPPAPTPDCYTVDQEINDITLIAQHLGATVDVYGFSSGADLALLAAQAGAPIRTLYLLEPPLFEPGTLAVERARMKDLLARDRQQARDYYLRDVVGIPADIVGQIPTLEQHLADVPASLHELTFLPGCNAQRFEGLATPTVLMVSTHNRPRLKRWAAELEQALPQSTLHELPASGMAFPRKCSWQRSAITLTSKPDQTQPHIHTPWTGPILIGGPRPAIAGAPCLTPTQHSPRATA
ncbi:hypothetical protein GCM10023065_30170 [Microbacterium laevaniformans]